MQADTQILYVRLTWSDVVTGEGRELIAPLPISFGRAQDNTVVLNINEVSHRHAVLKVQDGGLILEDRRSTNGTYVNQDRIYRYGRELTVRKTDDGRYVVAYTRTNEHEQALQQFAAAPYVHLAVGYPGIRILDDIQEYRERTHDLQYAVNIQYGVIWLAIFILTQGPLRIFWLKWRYQGGSGLYPAVYRWESTPINKHLHQRPRLVRGTISHNLPSPSLSAETSCNHLSQRLRWLQETLSNALLPRPRLFAPVLPIVVRAREICQFRRRYSLMSVHVNSHLIVQQEIFVPGVANQRYRREFLNLSAR